MDGSSKCCDEQRLTPQLVSNRPGLSAIAYRVATYASARRTMLAEIASTPGVADLTTRRSDDFMITVLESWAAVCDVLSFYQERIANEAFLRTAIQRSSVQRLAELLGYELDPGLAATTLLSFEVEEQESLLLPAGLRVQSVPGPGDKPQKYETLEALVGDCRLSRPRAWPVPRGCNPLAVGRRGAHLAPEQDGVGAAAELRPGTELALFGTIDGAPALERLVVAGVDVDGTHLRLRWKDAIATSGWTDSATLSRVGRRFGLFGANAPDEYAVPAESSGVVTWSLVSTDWKVSAGSALALDGNYDVEPGTELLLRAGSSQTVVRVEKVSKDTATVGPLEQGVTHLEVTPSLAEIADLRRVELVELVGEPVRLWGYDYPELLREPRVLVEGGWLGPGSIEIGRAYEGEEIGEGRSIGADEVPLDRTVLLRDGRGEVVAGTIQGARLVTTEAQVTTTTDDPHTRDELGLGRGAHVSFGLVSGDLTEYEGLSRPKPALEIRMGDQSPVALELGSSPSSLGTLAAALQAGLRAARPHPAFSEAIVTVVHGRLLLLPGRPNVDLEVAAPADDDETIVELGLDGVQARGLPVLVGRRHGSTSLNPSATAPEVSVAMGPIGPRLVKPALGSGSIGLGTVASALQAAVRNADLAPCFRHANVVVHEGRLLVMPGPLGVAHRSYLALDLTLDDTPRLGTEGLELLGNVVEASHGETVADEVVGDGDPTEAFQQFSLGDGPLTHLTAATDTGRKSTLTVLVDGVRWTEVDTLFGQRADARVYTVDVDDDGVAHLCFGDGVTGSRLPAGKGNVVASYRKGVGLAGRVPKGALRSLLERPKGLEGVVNPQAADGGGDPERAAEARANAPSSVQTLGRIVSLRDFEQYALSLASVAKARATWVWDGAERAVHLTLAAQEGAALSSTALEALHASLGKVRDPNRRLMLGDYVPVPLRVEAVLTVDDDYVARDVEAKARDALETALDFDQLRLGASVHLSRIQSVLQGVQGVRAVDVDRLGYVRPDGLSDAEHEAFLVERGAARGPGSTVRAVQPYIRIFAARPDPGRPGSVRSGELAVLEVPSRDLVLTTRGGLPR